MTLGPALLFPALVLGFLYLDLHQHRNDQPVTLRNAALWSLTWVGVALGFAGYLAVTASPEQAWLFTSGYLLEKSLSVDNLFVFLAVFGSFGVKDAMQHRILYYGILGALVFRLLFITLGSSFLLVGNLHPVAHMLVYSAFGGIVLWSAYKMVGGEGDDAAEEKVDYTDHWSVRMSSASLPAYRVSAQLDGHNFFTKKNGRWAATPLLLCLIVIETSDIAFAFDSVPAVIALTKVPFLVYTSNVFAILGLRSMYFLLSAAKQHLCHLEKAVIGILVFIGVKLLGEAFSFAIPASVSLAVIAGGLAAGIAGSFVFPERADA